MDKNNQACFKPAAKFHPSLYAAIKFVQTKLENCSVEVHTSLTFFSEVTIPYTLRSLLFKGTNFCVFCDLQKSAKFKDRKIYAACVSGAALYSMRTLRAR